MAKGRRTVSAHDLGIFAGALVRSLLPGGSVRSSSSFQQRVLDAAKEMLVRDKRNSGGARDGSDAADLDRGSQARGSEPCHVAPQHPCLKSKGSGCLQRRERRSEITGKLNVVAAT